FDQWSELMRIQVNDTLLFKNKKGSDVVLEVNKDDYDKCNIDNPIKKMDDENSVYDFDRLGSFCFVSGNKDKCKEGQKFVIVVAAEVRLSPSVSKEDKEEHHTFLTRQQSKEDKKSTILS
uniref:CT099 n=1 Tax=Solanum tuberosum TaxID=4113 RepID=M1DF95_SOLTU